jgi:periplasmic protein TonB
MSTETLTWFELQDVDSPWRRLHWTLPTALLICTITSILFVYSMQSSVSRTPDPVPVDAQLIELPAPALPKPPSHQRAPAPRQIQPTLPIKQEQPSTNPTPVAPPAAPSVPAAPAAPHNIVVPDQNRSAQAIAQPIPDIPDDLREEALNEIAKARFHIAADGSVTVELIKPTQNPRLNRLLLEKLKFWKFAPAIVGGKPVASTEDVVVRVHVN